MGRLLPGQRRQKIALPTYPFQRERFWFDVDESEINRPAVDFRERFSTLSPVHRLSPKVQRLPTAIPLFESWLELHETADKMALVHENSMAVARLFWGEGVHQVADLSLSSRLLTAVEPILTQTTINMTAADAATFQTFGAGEDQNEWHLLAGGQLRRGPRTATETAVHTEDSSDHRLSSIVRQQPQTQRQTLLAAAADEQLRLAAHYLLERTAAVLDLDPAHVAFDQPLDTLGMDSLMAIELKNRLQHDLQVDLPVVAFLQGPTIEQLASQLVAYLGEPVGAPAVQALTVPGEPGLLTYGQQAMWVLHQLLPADVSFNVAGAARLRGELDVSAFDRALQKLVERHSSLRTTFHMVSGEPVQIVHARKMLRGENEVLTLIDASAWDQETLDSFLQREAYRPFDLENGPLLRVLLLKRGDQEHLLLLSLNHLITDFWSMSLLVQDIYLLYTAELEGRQVELPVIELHTADYARWQEEMLAGPEGEAHRQYWHEQLAGELPRLDLPTDRPRPAAMTFDGGTESRHYDPELTEKLRALSAEHGATLATTLLAAFQTLLHRYTGQEDLLVGTVIAGRERPELQDLVGYYINSVALRADFSGRQARRWAGTRHCPIFC